VRLPIVGPLTPLHVADGAAFTTFTTFQDVSPSPQLVLPQQMMDVGMELFLYANGEFSTTGTPTLSIGFWFNGAAGAAPTSVLAQTTATTTGSAAGDRRVGVVQGHRHPAPGHVADRDGGPHPDARHGRRADGDGGHHREPRDRRGGRVGHQQRVQLDHHVQPDGLGRQLTSSS
jgi:hypothetical protein